LLLRGPQQAARSQERVLAEALAALVGAFFPDATEAAAAARLVTLAMAVAVAPVAIAQLTGLRAQVAAAAAAEAARITVHAAILGTLVALAAGV